MSSGKAYGLLSSLADRAQGLLAGGSTGEGQQTAQGQAHAGQEQSGTLSGRYPGLEVLSHQIRSVKAQYS